MLFEISINLSSEEYAQALKKYIIGKWSFKVFVFILWGCVILSNYFYTMNYENVSLTYNMIITIFVLLYTFLMPHLIYNRAKIIYANTAFLHDTMILQFTQDAITWKTTKGENTFSLNKIYQIKYFKNNITLAFNRILILPLPFTQISEEQKKELMTLLFKNKK